MTVDEISKLAYNEQDPDGALPYETLLWYRLRDLYRAVRNNQMTKAHGADLKTGALAAFQVGKIQYDRAVMLWQHIEQAGIAYANDRTLENADGLYRAVYGMEPGGR